MIRYRMVFTGTVQQVGFRFFSSKFANENQCTGWVKNQYDGSVLMEIQGKENQINQVIEQLNNISHIVIQNINKTKIPLQEEAGFQITF